MTEFVCPHCGDNDGYGLNQQIRGVQEIHVDPSTGARELEDMRTSYVSDPKTAFCLSCLKRFPNPELGQSPELG